MVLAKVKAELNRLKHKAHLDSQVWEQFWERVNDGLPLTKKENNPQHLCAFFLPVHLPTQSIYLGYHLKGDDWMPPGGHVEPQEVPLQTVEREFAEELGLPLGSSQVELFNLSIKPITNHPQNYCLRHFDFWYLVWTKEQLPFRFDPGEFRDAGWFKLNEGAQMITKNPDFKKAILQIADIYFK